MANAVHPLPLVGHLANFKREMKFQSRACFVHKTETLSIVSKRFFKLHDMLL